MGGEGRGGKEGGMGGRELISQPLPLMGNHVQCTCTRFPIGFLHYPQLSMCM